MCDSAKSPPDRHKTLSGADRVKMNQMNRVKMVKNPFWPPVSLTYLKFYCRSICCRFVKQNLLNKSNKQKIKKIKEMASSLCPNPHLASYLLTMSKLKLSAIAGRCRFLCKSPPWLFRWQSYPESYPSSASVQGSRTVASGLNGATIANSTSNRDEVWIVFSGYYY